MTKMIGFPAENFPKLQQYINQIPHRIAITLMEVIGPLHEITINEEAPNVESPDPAPDSPSL